MGPKLWMLLLLLLVGVPAALTAWPQGAAPGLPGPLGEMRPCTAHDTQTAGCSSRVLCLKDEQPQWLQFVALLSQQQYLHCYNKVLQVPRWDYHDSSHPTVWSEDGSCICKPPAPCNCKQPLCYGQYHCALHHVTQVTLATALAAFDRNAVPCILTCASHWAHCAASSGSLSTCSRSQMR